MLNRGPQRCPSLDRDTRYYFAAVRQFHAFRGIALFIEYSDCENRCIDRVFVGLLLEEVEQY